MRGHDLNHHNRGDEHWLVDFDRVEEAAFVECTPREIGNLLPNNQRQRRTCYALCHTLYPVSECTPAFRVSRFWIRVLGFEIRILGSGMFGFWSLGFWNVGFQVLGVEPWVSAFDFKKQGLGVLAFGLRVSGLWL